DLRALGVRCELGDVTDRESVRRAMAGAERLFHCAAWYRIGARGRDQAYRINVDGTRNVLEAMRELGVAKGVYTSTVAVCVDAHGVALERGRAGESYVIAGRPHTLVEALLIAERVCGIPAPRLAVPPPLLRLAAGVTAVLGQDAESLRVLAGVTYLASSAKA